MTTTTNGTLPAVAAGTAQLNISLTQVRFSCWTGERQVSDDEAAQLLSVDLDESNYKLVKKLIDQDILRHIKSIQNAAKTRIKQYCLRFPLTNVLAVPKKACDIVEQIVEKARDDVQQAVDIMVYGGEFKLTQKTTKMIHGWSSLVDQARTKLGVAFREKDYPTAHQLRGKFSVEMMPFFDLTPSSSKQHNAMDDILKQFKDEATAVLRSNFLSIIGKLAEKLEDKYDEKTGVLKRQKLYDSHMEDLAHFLKWVGDLNVGEDETIIQMVASCKAALSNEGMLDEYGVRVATGMNKLKNYSHYREAVRNQFLAIGEQFQPVEVNNGTEITKKEETPPLDESVTPDVIPLNGVTINKKKKVDEKTGIAADFPA